MTFNFMYGVPDYCLEPTAPGGPGHVPGPGLPYYHQHAQQPPHSIACTTSIDTHTDFQYTDLNIRNKPETDVKTDNKSKKVRKRKPPGSICSRAELKRRRNAGEEYITRKGKVINKKEYRTTECRCRLDCTAKVSHDVRKLIFDQFHALADWNNQTQFIVSSVTILDVKERKKRIKQESCGSNSRRCASRIFYLTNQKIRVCKPVFLSTLGITNKRLDYALRHKAIPLTSLATPDLRGKKGPTNKTPSDVEERVRAHINSFSKFSNPLAKSAKADLNSTSEVTISKMYLLYQEQCLAHGIVPASMWVYAKIYHSEFKGPATKEKLHARHVKERKQSYVVETDLRKLFRCCSKSIKNL